MKMGLTVSWFRIGYTDGFNGSVPNIPVGYRSESEYKRGYKLGKKDAADQIARSERQVGDM